MSLFCDEVEVLQECPEPDVKVCDPKAVMDEIYKLQKFSLSLDEQLKRLKAAKPPYGDDDELLCRTEDQVQAILSRRLHELESAKRKDSKKFTFLEKSAMKYQNKFNVVENCIAQNEKLIACSLEKFSKVEEKMNKKVAKLRKDTNDEWNQLLKIKRKFTRINGEVEKLKDEIADLEKKNSSCQDDIDFIEKMTYKTQLKLIDQIELKKAMKSVEIELFANSENFEEDFPAVQDLSNELITVINQVSEEKEKLKKIFNEIAENDAILMEVLNPWKDQLAAENPSLVADYQKKKNFQDCMIDEFVRQIAAIRMKIENYQN